MKNGFFSNKVLLVFMFLTSMIFAKDNLILHYDFNSLDKDRVIDSSGNDRFGKLQEGAIIVDDKEMGKVLRLNGLGAYLELPENILKKLDEYSFSTFVNLHEYSNWVRIFDLGSATNKYTFLSPTGGGGKLIWDTNDTTKIVSVSTPSMIPLNTWVNITCTYKNGLSIIYFNGNEVARVEGEEPNIKTLGNTLKNYIGKSQFSADPTITADFADIKLFDVALSKAEIEKNCENKVNRDVVKLENIDIVSKVGEQLKLPKTIKATTSEGKTRDIPVFWEEVSVDKIKRDGTFTIIGKVGGISLTSTANVVVKSMSLSKNYSIFINIINEINKDESKNIEANFNIVKNITQNSTVEVKVEFYENSKVIKEISKLIDLKEEVTNYKLKELIPSEMKEKSYSVVAYVSELRNGSTTVISEPLVKNIRPLGILNNISSDDVRLSENTLFGDSQQTGLAYVMSLDPDRLLAPYYEAVGRKSEAKGKKYGGWEAQQIAGHSLGHYLSALSDFYASTGSKEAKEKLEYVISELKNIQREDGYLGGVTSKPFEMAFSGKVNADGFSLNGYWVPWYNVHKAYAGLMDAYKIAGNKDSLDILIKMANWIYNGSINMSDKEFQQMLLCEHGGMNEVMADLYGITKDEKYLYLAKRFTQNIIIDPLSKGIDSLQGLHANTQIPKIIGAARIYELTGDEYYGRAAKFFFDTVIDHRSFVIGGNSVSEHFGPSDIENLAKDSCETCNTYNMLKLAEHIFSWTKDVKYTDYYEKALYNHILASQDPDTGAKTYFVSTYPGHFKVYGTDETAFWCCTGTGMENPGRYNRFIYYLENNDLYINLFISSTLNIKEKGIKLEQTTNFPYEDKSVIKVLEANGEKININIRVPYWINGRLIAKVGTDEYSSDKNGYLSINRVWKKGDTIDITMPMKLHEYTSMDSSNKVAFLYGPIVLAAKLGREKFPAKDIIPNHLALMNWSKIDVPKLITEEKDLNKWIKASDLSTLTFSIDKNIVSSEQELVLEPFYKVNHERYTMYFDKFTKKEYENSDILKKSRDEILEPITIDVVKTGEQQSEVEHKFESKNSNTGYLSSIDMRWRDASKGGFIKYEMSVKSDKKVLLMVTYYDKDKSVKGVERTFDILINNKKINQVELMGTGKDKSVDFIYEIPEGILVGDTAEVMFKSNDQTVFVGGILEVRTIVKQ